MPKTKSKKKSELESSEPKVIGKGSYGCVYKPTLKCKGEKKQRPGVSKLLLKKAAKDEYERTANINKIHNYRNYYIIPEHRCVASEPYPESCDINSTGNDMNLLFYNDGGKDLEEILASGKYSFEQIMFSMQNIFRGITLMNKEGKYHNDIKPANIVVDEHGKFRLIDFGLASDLSLNSIYGTNYAFWPFEFHILGGISSYDMNYVIEYYYNEYRSSLMKFLEQTPEEIEKSDLYNTIEIFKTKNTEEIQEQAKKVADVYSIGMTFLSIMEFFPKKLDKQLKSLLKKLTTNNPFNRLTPAMAEKQYISYLASAFPPKKMGMGAGAGAGASN